MAGPMTLAVPPVYGLPDGSKQTEGPTEAFTGHDHPSFDARGIRPVHPPMTVTAVTSPSHTRLPITGGDLDLPGPSRKPPMTAKAGPGP